MNKSSILLCYALSLAAFTQTAYAGPTDRKALEISSNNAQLIKKLSDYKNLERLTINCLEDLKELPASIGELTRLKEINMDNGNGCSMNPRIPEAIGKLIALETLNLSGAQDNRGTANGKDGPRHPLPSSFENLSRLKVLNLGRNGYTKVPEAVALLKSLEVLNLDYNDFSDLPHWLVLTPVRRVTLGDNCDISGSKAKQADLKRRFPRIQFEFTNEFDCE